MDYVLNINDYRPNFSTAIKASPNVYSSIPMENDYAFLQADVEALYPSIHIDDGLASLYQTLLKANIEATERILIIRLTQ